MTKVYVIRHGETESNMTGRVSGFYDTHLTSRGMLQAQCLGERFKDIDIDAVYSSHRSRAMKTAQAIADRKGLTVITTPRVSEINMGVWDNRNWGEIEAEDGGRQMMKIYREQFQNWYAPYCERLDEQRLRVRGAICDLAAEHDGGTIAVVCHGGVIRALIAEAGNIPDDEVPNIKGAGNTSVTLVNVDGENMTLEFSNDSSHLEGHYDKFGSPLFDKASTVSSSFNKYNVYTKHFDFDKDAEYYTEKRREQYVRLMGSDKGFDGGKYLKAAKERAKRNPDNVMACIANGEKVGIVELDGLKEAEKGCGWIEFYYTDPCLSGTRSVMHPMGEIISYYRALNRVELKMAIANVPDDVEKFLLTRDFEILSKESGITVFTYDLYR